LQTGWLPGRQDREASLPPPLPLLAEWAGVPSLRTRGAGAPLPPLLLPLPSLPLLLPLPLLPLPSLPLPLLLLLLLPPLSVPLLLLPHSFSSVLSPLLL
jgi:hypothetical protein